MKSVLKFATLALLVAAIPGMSYSQQAKVVKPFNLERGVVGPITSNGSWSGYSEIALIPGAGLVPSTSTTAAFYLGFAGGTQADISNMVLYTTARNSSVITAVTPVKYGGVSNPSINLASTSVCKVQPLSVTNPCTVKLDTLTLTLSAVSDYYLVIYFTANDNNNSAIQAAQSVNLITSLRGWFISSDQTRLTAGQSLPSGCCSVTDFLMYVMSN